MEPNGKILLSVYDGKDVLIDHIAVINKPEREGSKLRAEMRARFNMYIKKKCPNPDKYMVCKFMFIYPSKEGIEWILWNDSVKNVEIGYHPVKRSFQTSIFYYKPEEGVQLKTF